MLFPPSHNSTSEMLSWRNVLSYSCSSSRLVISHLDYCNSVLSNLPSSKLQPLSSVLHTAARLIKDLSHAYTEATAPVSSSKSLHMYYIHSGTSWYMHSMVTTWSASIRSSTWGDFDIENGTASVCQCTSVVQFKSKLKTALFSVFCH